MTKAELLKALEHIPDDVHIVMSINMDRTVFHEIKGVLPPDSVDPDCWLIDWEVGTLNSNN